MAFYIKPPKGLISRRKLRIYAEKRFLFLVDLVKCGDDNEKISQLLQKISTVDGSECLITGSLCDKISHFILRLAHCNSHAKTEWFIKAECILFKIRLDAQSADEKEQCLKDTLHQVIKFSNFQPHPYRQLLLTLKFVCKCLKMRQDNKSVIIKVPFEYALRFVRNRELQLQNGKVLVPMQKIGELLLSLHELILYEGIQQMKITGCVINAQSDSRIKDIANHLKSHFISLEHKPLKIILAKNVDSASKQFPPCMLHLYRILKHRHRLKHSARIQLTLFLKDIGMPLEEALIFWKSEYAKPATCHSACSHSWTPDQKRYTYNIRHLYGKEGSCKNYRSQSCSALQDGLIGFGHEGGCPFAQFDIENIGKVILANNMKEQQVEEITHCIQQKDYREACLQYLTAQYLNKRDAILPTQCNEISSKTQNCNDASNELLSHKTVTNSYAFSKNNFSKDHNMIISDSCVTHANSSKRANIQQFVSESEYYSSVTSHDHQALKKLVNVVHRPVDYFKSFQLLLEGIRKGNACSY